MDRAENLLLKLRALFGRQSRAEVMAWLLANETGHPAEIARQTGHFRRSIQITLNELERSGHVRAQRQGREKRFSLRRDEWTFLATWNTPADRCFPVWLRWAPIFRLFEVLDTLLDDTSQAGLSPESRSIEWRRRLDFATLVDSGFPSGLSSPVEARGAEALTEIQERFRRLWSFLVSV